MYNFNFFFILNQTQMFYKYVLQKIKRKNYIFIYGRRKSEIKFSLGQFY